MTTIYIYYFKIIAIKCSKIDSANYMNSFKTKKVKVQTFS